MADVVAYHVVGKNSNGEIVSDTYVSPDNLRIVVRTLNEEYLKVEKEPLTELPDGVELKG